MPFQQRFEDVTPFQKTAYFVTLVFTAISTAMFIAPSAFHRFTFRLQQKERLVQFGNRCMIGGIAALAVAMTCAMTLITDWLYGATATVIAAGLILVMFVVLWLAIPLHGRQEARGDS